MKIPTGRTVQVAAAAVGLAAGIGVTTGLHANPKPAFWGDRLGDSGFRTANLPVGGTIAFIAAGLLRKHAIARPIAALGVGMTVGAVGTGVVDPLPAQRRARVVPTAAAQVLAVSRLA